jgi:hypothetical protein
MYEDFGAQVADRSVEFSLFNLFFPDIVVLNYHQSA